MNNKILSAVFLLLTISISTAFGQAWDKSSKVLGFGVGGASFFHISTNNNYYTGVFSPITGQLNFKMEFGVHEYVGVGFQTGIGGGGPNTPGWGRRGFWGYKSFYNGSFNFPISGFANFHFYQLIADKTGKDIHADKLDIYAGANIGSGIGVLFYDNGTQITPLAFGGVHVGARYFFTEKFGVNLELGYGKNIVNGGIVFKL